jgi:hypothetical protein
LASLHGKIAMTDEQPTAEYDLAQEGGGHRFAWIAAALALMLAVGAGVWGWTAQHGAGDAREALASAIAERDQAVAEARQWRTLLDQAETAAQSTDAKVAELEQRVQSLDELLQTANMDVSRLESEVATRDAEDVSSEEPPEAAAAIAVGEAPAAGGSLGMVAPAPVAAVEPAAAPPAETAPAGAAPTPLVAAAPAVAGGPAQKLSVVFDVNSSYLPASLDGRLRDLAAKLEPSQSYLVELVGSVGHPDVEGQSAEEALRYNRWMAERRMTRVAEYLQKNTKAEKLTFRQNFALNDPSRQVLVEVRPVQE